jgi:outer membrane protein TolC
MIDALFLSVALTSTPVSLEDVRSISRHNTSALLAELDKLRAHEQWRTSRAAILPQLNMNADVGQVFVGPYRSVQTYPTGDLNPDGTPVFAQRAANVPGVNRGLFDASLALTQLIIDGGRWWNQISQSGAQEDAARGQEIEAQLTSEFEGIRRFYQLYLAQKTLEVLEATVKRSADQLIVANAMFEAGRSPKSDAISAQVNLGNDRIAAIAQRGNIANAQSDLAVWILRRGDDDLAAVEPAAMRSPAAPAPPLDQAVVTGRERRPLIKALTDSARAADLGVSVARAPYWPTVQGQATYLRQGTSFDPVFTNRHLQNQLSLTLSLRWNLFSGLATDAAVNTALHNRTTAVLNLAQAQRELEGDVRRNLRTLEAQLEARHAAEENLDAAKAGLSLAQERFKAGAGSTLEVRDAQLKLTQSELTVIQAKVNAETARANLDRVTGSLNSGG